MRQLLDQRHRADVERVARGGLERADAAFAENHAGVSFLQDVFGGQQEFFNRGVHAAFQQHRPFSVCRPFSAVESSACCGCRSGSQSAYSETRATSAEETASVTTFIAKRSRLAATAQAVHAQPLERVRRRAWFEGAAAKETDPDRGKAPARWRKSALRIRPRTVLQ